MPRTPLLLPADTVRTIRRRCVERGLPDPGSICIARALAFWDNVSPGNGLAITEALEQFYALGTAFPLREPQAVLASITPENFGWLGVRQYVTASHLSDANRAIGMKFGDVNGLPLRLQLERRVQDDLDDVLGTWLSMRLPELVWDSLEHRLCVGVERHFSDEERSAAYELVHEALNASLTFAVSAVITGKAQTYQPLLDLWLSGNWPVGCTADGALVVFAEPALVGTESIPG